MYVCLCCCQMLQFMLEKKIFLKFHLYMNSLTDKLTDNTYIYMYIIFIYT